MEMSKQMRTFVALEIPEDSLQKIGIIQKSIQNRIHSHVSWVKPESMHITLKFIGEIDNKRIEDLKMHINDLCEKINPFQIDMKGFGCFPSIRNPKILWLGFVENQAMKTLAEEIEIACLNTGIPVEDRSFSPHLTLGRVKSSLSSAEIEFIRSMIDSQKKELYTQWIGSQVVLFQSKLEQSGPVYTPLERFVLQK